MRWFALGLVLLALGTATCSMRRPPPARVTRAGPAVLAAPAEQPVPVQPDARIVIDQPSRIFGDSRFAFPLAALTFSPDGKLLAAAGAGPDFTPMLADAATGKVLHRLPGGYESYVNQFAFSPDGKRLYAGGELHGLGMATPDRTLRVWDVATGEKIHEHAADCWALSPDGKLVVTVTNIWGHADAGQGRAPARFQVFFHDTTTWQQRNIMATGHLVSALGITPDGATLALATGRTIRFLSIETRKELRRIETPAPWTDHQADVFFLAFSPDGARLASVNDTSVNIGVERTVVLWDLAAGKEIRRLTGPEGPASGLAFTPDGCQLIVTGKRNCWQLFDVASGKRMRSVGPTPGHASAALTLLRQGKAPAERSDPPTLLDQLWDVATGEDVRSQRVPANLTSLTLSADDRLLAAGDANGIIRIWDFASGKETALLRNLEKRSVHRLGFSPDGKLLVSAHWNGALLFWDLATQRHREHDYRTGFASICAFALAAIRSSTCE